MFGHGKVPTLLHRHPIYILPIPYPFTLLHWPVPPTQPTYCFSNPFSFLFLLLLRWLGVDEKGRLFFSFSCHVGDTKSEDDPSMVFF